MIIGSSLGVLDVRGMMARPRATSSRTNSGVQPSRTAMKRISAVISPRRA
jgi:hypothetical protein